LSPRPLDSGTNEDDVTVGIQEEQQQPQQQQTPGTAAQLSAVPVPDLFF